MVETGHPVTGTGSCVGLKQSCEQSHMNSLASCLIRSTYLTSQSDLCPATLLTCQTSLRPSMTPRRADLLVNHIGLSDLSLAPVSGVMEMDALPTGARRRRRSAPSVIYPEVLIIIDYDGFL